MVPSIIWTISREVRMTTSATLALQLDRMSIFDIVTQIADTENCINFLRQIKLLANDQSCNKCNLPMTVQSKPSRVTHDLQQWVCHKCRTSLSIRHRSIFKNMHISLQDATMMLYLFCKDFPIFQTEKMLPDLAHTTVVHFYGKMRDLIFHSMDNMTFDAEIEGYHDIIEIDESFFGKKRKYNKGNATKRQWIFGMIQRNTKKSFFIPVNKRDNSTLIPIIKSKVNKGSTIYHDDWPAYRNLEEEGYISHVVNHSKEFVSVDGTCTNTIEG